MNDFYYVEYILRTNGFYDFEIPYYQGESNANPHGIDKKIWNDVSSQIGFNLDNMELINGRYYLKGLNYEKK